MSKINLDTKDIITILIALYGAVLSTIIFFRERRKEKRTVLLFYEADWLMNLFILRVVNAGFRPITLVDAGLKIHIKHGIRWKHIDTIKATEKLPATLTDSKPETWVFEQADIKRVLRSGLQAPPNPKFKVVGYVRDATGKTYEISNPKRYNHNSDDFNLHPS